MNIAVTAASGQLGSAVIKSLSEKLPCENIIAIARTPDKAKHLGVVVRQADYNSQTDFEKALQGIDTVLIVSGMDSPDKRITQHRNIIRAAALAGVKKIVYTSVQGEEHGNAFSPIVQSNRQTEQDVHDSGLAWVIGRNGIYIEPDIEYIEHYKKSGEIANCAAQGKCAYTSRSELAYAYAQILMDDKHNGKIYKLHGDRLTQSQLAAYLSETFATPIVYRTMEVEAYKQERIAELGEFIGTVIAGIYTAIRSGALDHDSDFTKAAGRVHQSWDNYFLQLNRSL